MTRTRMMTPDGVPARSTGRRSIGRLRAGHLAVPLLACLALGGPALAKKPAVHWAVIAGTLFTPEATLARGAQVEVRQLNGKKHWSTTTDDAGEFDVPVPAGHADYEIEAKFRGFQPLKAKVQVQADEKVTVFLHLQR